MAISEPGALDGSTPVPASDVIPDVLGLLWRRTRRTIKNLPKRPSTDDIRAVRKHLSALRSATLLAAPVGGAAATDFAARILRVTADLDVIIEARYCEEWIRDRDARSGVVDPAIIEQLLAAQAADADAARRAWRDSWDQCRSRSLTKWFRA